MVAGLTLAALLASWNTATNLLGLPRRWYVPAGMLLVAALLAAASVLDLREVGLSWPQDLRVAGLAVTAVAVAVATLGALAGVVPGVGRLLDDARADLDDDTLLREVLWRIPLGTALVEELAFRGVLLAAFDAAASTTTATLLGAAAFGVWHVAPTAVTLRRNGVRPSSRRGLAAIGAAVLATGVAGVVLSVLRWVSGGILAPALAHWALNALTLLVAVAHRRSPSTRS